MKIKQSKFILFYLKNRFTTINTRENYTIKVCIRQAGTVMNSNIIRPTMNITAPSNNQFNQYSIDSDIPTWNFINDLHFNTKSDSSSSYRETISSSRKSIISCLHFLFKIFSCIMFYFGSFLFGGWEGDYVLTFVFTVILVSLDFWIVKNITGRFLVGMRWWSNVKHDGSNEWIYETNNNHEIIEKRDKNFFWIILWSWSIFWLFSLFVAVIRLHFEWILLILISLVLALANLYGYWQCSKMIRKKTEQWAFLSICSKLINRFM